MKINSLVSAALISILVAGSVGADTPKPEPAAPSAAAILKKIEKQIGFVPDFIRAIPPTLLPSFWAGMEEFQNNPSTALDNKTKELIGLAVAAQVPCEYCIIYHTEMAKLNGATDMEIREAVAQASLTREGSTLLNGLQVDKVQFKKDLARMTKGAHNPQARK